MCFWLGAALLLSGRLSVLDLGFVFVMFGFAAVLFVLFCGLLDWCFFLFAVFVVGGLVGLVWLVWELTVNC